MIVKKNNISYSSKLCNDKKISIKKPNQIFQDTAFNDNIQLFINSTTYLCPLQTNTIRCDKLPYITSTVKIRN